MNEESRQRSNLGVVMSVVLPLAAISLHSLFDFGYYASSFGGALIAIIVTRFLK